MFSLLQPSIVYHSADVPGTRYEMWVTRRVRVNASLKYLIDDTAKIIKNSKYGFVHNLIFNCHGEAGRAYYEREGRRSINIKNVQHFSVLRGLVRRIIIVACEITSEAEIKYSGYGGDWFCTRLAYFAGCPVVAADVEQETNEEFSTNYYPFGYIDDFEGTVTEYAPDGKRRILPNLRSFYMDLNGLDFTT